MSSKTTRSFARYILCLQTKMDFIEFTQFIVLQMDQRNRFKQPTIYDFKLLLPSSATVHKIQEKQCQ